MVYNKYRRGVLSDFFEKGGRFMILKMIKTGKRAAKKCKKAFEQKAKIMRKKGRQLAKKGRIIERKAETIKEKFTDEI